MLNFFDSVSCETIIAENDAYEQVLAMVRLPINDGKTHLHLDVDAELDKDELMSILKSIGLN